MGSVMVHMAWAHTRKRHFRGVMAQPTLACIRRVARHQFPGALALQNRAGSIGGGMVEVAVRAYDPCLSCATHAMGKMPLQINLVNEQDELVDRLEKSATGNISRTR